MPFYTFDQNNSGGGYDDPACYVIIEADNANEANDSAEKVGIYFNGVEDGRDCECCGGRWCKVEDDTYDERAFPNICGRRELMESDNYLIFYKDEDEARAQNAAFNDETKLRDGGFTVIELLIVFAIMIVLAAIIVPNCVKYNERAKSLPAEEAPKRAKEVLLGAGVYEVQIDNGVLCYGITHRPDGGLSCVPPLK